MKISINTGEEFGETQVEITCKTITPEIEKIISMLRLLDMKLSGIKDGETYILDVTKLLYIDTADKKTFLYTKSEVYETSLRLYELEEKLPEDFFRAGKSCIINLRQIHSLKADLEGRIKVTMSNGERLVISRQYAGNVKRKLGL